MDNRDDGLLPRLFALEYAALFDVLGPALAAWRLPYPLGGTSTHFRTAALRDVHGWDAWNVTEDADLGLRLAVAGYHVGDLPSATYEEGLCRVYPFLRQRSRWMKGFLQTATVHLRQPGLAWRRLGPLGCLGGLSVVLGTVATALSYPVLTTLALWGVVETFTRPARSTSGGPGPRADRGGRGGDDPAGRARRRASRLVVARAPRGPDAPLLRARERRGVARPRRSPARALALGEDRARPRALLEER